MGSRRISIAVLVATGVLMLGARGLLHWSGVLGSALFWRSAFGTALAAKPAIVDAPTPSAPGSSWTTCVRSAS